MSLNILKFLNSLSNVWKVRHVVTGNTWSSYKKCDILKKLCYVLIECCLTERMKNFIWRRHSIHPLWTSQCKFLHDLCQNTQEAAKFSQEFLFPGIYLLHRTTGNEEAPRHFTWYNRSSFLLPHTSNGYSAHVLFFFSDEREREKVSVHQVMNF